MPLDSDPLATVAGRLQHLATLAGVTLDALSSLAGLSRRTLSSVTGNRLHAKSAVAVGLVTAATEDGAKQIAGWICAGAAPAPSEDDVREAVREARARA